MPIATTVAPITTTNSTVSAIAYIIQFCTKLIAAKNAFAPALPSATVNRIVAPCSAAS